mmetsp:Transcript_22407/g.45308  ORF Transcript_22407/g.45308 Transcript_22407/m.45308 type:complete len:121 (-) Transcript_22407:338-700(-)
MKMTAGTEETRYICLQLGKTTAIAAAKQTPSAKSICITDAVVALCSSFDNSIMNTNATKSAPPIQIPATRRTVKREYGPTAMEPIIEKINPRNVAEYTAGCLPQVSAIHPKKGSPSSQPK